MSASQAFSEACDSIQSIILIISNRLIPPGLRWAWNLGL